MFVLTILCCVIVQTCCKPVAQTVNEAALTPQQGRVHTGRTVAPLSTEGVTTTALPTTEVNTEEIIDPLITNSETDVSATLQPVVANTNYVDVNSKLRRVHKVAHVSAQPNVGPVVSNDVSAKLNAPIAVSDSSIDDVSSRIHPLVGNGGNDATNLQRVMENANIDEDSSNVQPLVANVNENDGGRNLQHVVAANNGGGRNVQHVLATNNDDVNTNLQQIVTNPEVDDVTSNLQSLGTANTNHVSLTSLENPPPLSSLESHVPALTSLESHVNPALTSFNSANELVTPVGEINVDGVATKPNYEICAINPSPCSDAYAKHVCDICQTGHQSIAQTSPLVANKCDANPCECCQETHGNNCQGVCSGIEPHHPRLVHTYDGTCLHKNPCQCCLEAANNHHESCVPVCADQSPVPARAIHIHLNKCHGNPCQCCHVREQKNCDAVCLHHVNGGHSHLVHTHPLIVHHQHVLHDQHECSPLDHGCIVDGYTHGGSDNSHEGDVLAHHALEGSDLGAHNIHHGNYADNDVSNINGGYISHNTNDVLAHHDLEGGELGSMHHGNYTDDDVNSHDGGYISHDTHDGDVLAHRDLEGGGLGNMHHGNYTEDDVNSHDGGYISHGDDDISSPHELATVHEDDHHDNDAPGCDCNCSCNCGTDVAAGVPKIPGIEHVDYVDHTREGCKCSVDECDCDISTVCKRPCQEKCFKKCKCPKT